MKRFLIVLLLFLVAGLFTVSEQTFAARKKDGGTNKPVRLTKSLQGVNRTLVNVGQVAMWIYSQGKSAVTPGGDSGLMFPRGNGTLTAAIFEDGFIWGGQVNDGGSPLVRVGGQTYDDGLVPGRIISQGVAEDFGDPAVDRIWRIRRDYPTADLLQDAAEINEVLAPQVTEAQIAEVRAQYERDWIDWPAEKGAPFYDADGDGVYTPGFNADGTPKLRPKPGEEFDPAIHADEPGVADADQVVWGVANDLDASTVQNLYGSPSIGFEMQSTLWAYRRADALGQIIFKQFRIIWKGTATTPATATIDSTFFSQWSDPDVGSFGDDFVGSDTTLSLGYAYNSQTVDANYSSVGLPPPASGYDFFAGPLVPDPDGVAIFGLKPRPGFRNLPMSSFAFFAAGQQDSDPTLGGDYNGTLQWWNLLRGFRPRPEFPPQPWINPQTGEVTKFRVPGDPVTGTGWIDENPGDRRLLLVAGPFTMALGDTQETVVAVMAALGSDRLSSISVLKFVDRFAQEAFDNLFELPKPPPTPVVNATELDGEVLLNWGEDQNAVAAVEDFDAKGFVFEGYNIYQLPNAGASLDQGIRIATFDLVNEVTVIAQETFDPTSGLILELPVQFGSNSGIVRTITLDTDKIREAPLVNGQTYFFGITAYSFNPAPGLTTRTLESPPAILQVVPQTTKPGVRFRSAIGDTITGIVHDGPSDGFVTVIVSDPSKLTGDDYKVVFSEDAEGNSLWHLINVTRGDTVLANQTNQTGDPNIGALNSEGIQLTVVGAPNDFKNFEVVANAAGPLDPPEGGAADFQGFPSLRPTDRQQVGEGHWFFHTGDNGGSSGGGTRGSFSAFKSRVARGDKVSRIVPFDFEMRFTAAGSIAIWAFETELTGPVPYELWNIGSNTPDDPSDDYRMIPWVLNDWNFGDATDQSWDLNPLDHSASSADNDPYTDWTYWRNPVDISPGTAGYDQFVADATAGTYDFASPEVMARTVLINWNGGDVFDPTFPANVNQILPEEGTIFRITSTKPNTPNDTFTFSTAGFQPTSNQTTAKQDLLELVNVFPNPYNGFNSRELNRFTRFVTFSHLPQRATIRIFNLAGALVRTIEKDDASQFINWDLKNQEDLPVASGIYIARCEFPDLGVTKNLKLAIIMEQQFLRNF
jgi:hypothetical protein